MRCHWEKLGVLRPIYRLASEGLNDDIIAEKLNLREETVRGCVSWLLRFLNFKTRAELSQDASYVQSGRWALKAA